MLNSRAGFGTWQGAVFDGLQPDSYIVKHCCPINAL
jgi:hypothetical protein